MSKTKLTLAAASLVMAFAAANASADVFFQHNINAKSPVFSNSISFDVTSKSLADFSTGYYGSTSTLQYVMSNLLMKTGVSTWTSVWGSAEYYSGSNSSFAGASSLLLNPGIYKFSSIAFLTTGSTFKGTYFAGATVTPVPEPETYALAGLGLTALLLRRKQKKAASSYSLAA